MSAARDHFADRAAGDPMFLAHAILMNQLATGTDDAGLCAWLGITPEVLRGLRTCGRSRSGTG